MVMPIIGTRRPGNEMHMPAMTHWYCRTGYALDEMEVVLEEVRPGEEPVDMTLSARDRLTGDGRNAMVVSIRTGLSELGAAQDLVDMSLLCR